MPRLLGFHNASPYPAGGNQDPPEVEWSQFNLRGCGRGLRMVMPLASAAGEGNDGTGAHEITRFSKASPRSNAVRLPTVVAAMLARASLVKKPW